jgi:hypothetical protein
MDGMTPWLKTYTRPGAGQGQRIDRRHVPVPPAQRCALSVLLGVTADRILYNAIVRLSDDNVWRD